MDNNGYLVIAIYNRMASDIHHFLNGQEILINYKVLLFSFTVQSDFGVF